jgi:myxalamid-type nonribosomal peptide synthetase MxaA
MSEPSNDIVTAARIQADHPRGRDAVTRTSAAIDLPSGRAALPGCELAAIAVAVARQASSDAVTLGLAGPQLVGLSAMLTPPPNFASLCHHLVEAARSELPTAESPQIVVEQSEGVATNHTEIRVHVGTSDIHATWRADLFDESTIRRLLTRVAAILTAGLHDPDASIATLPVLLPEEHELLRAWNRSERPLDPTCTGRLIEHQAACTPDAPAVRCGTDEITYAELDRRAARLACHLRARGIAPGSLVAIHLERSIDAIVAFLAIWRAGAAYVPIDLDHPPARVAMMLGDCRPVALISRRSLVTDLPGPLPPLVDLDADHTAIAATPIAPIAVPTTLDDAAVVFYTSGSTGRPKGVVQRHRSVANWTAWQQRSFPMMVGDAELQTTPLGFGLSVAQIFHPLTSGACLVLVPPDRPIDGPTLVELLRRHAITKWVTVPALLTAALAAGLGACASLRQVVSTASSLPATLAVDVAAVVPTLVNGWGSTECFLATAIRCRAGSARGVVPIGAPIDNMDLHVLGGDLRPVPIGAPGELCVGGANLARGYLGLPELTAAKFVAHPFSPDPEARLYRTGDVARWRFDGALEFLGRSDHQTKIRGVRVEPGDVEAALVRHPEVREAVVVARPDHRGETMLVAYIVARDRAPTAGTLRTFLRGVLLDAMIPARFVALAALPLTNNKKLDRAALPAPDTHRPDTGRPYVPPRTPLEAELAALWAESLGLDSVGVHDDYFELGGDSLGAASLVASTAAITGTSLSLRAALATFTIADLAARPAGAPDARGATPAELAPEVHLDPAIVPRTPPRSTGRVLLTGATGFLGVHLVAALVAADVHIDCLVRADDPAHANRRLRAALTAAGVWTDALAARITAIPGDLARPRLGLDDATFAALADRVDEIFHAGALVDLLRPYAAVRASNVGGTHEVLRLATTGAIKPVRHVSTVAVGVAREADDPRHDHPLPTGYAASKWVAEMLVREAASRGVPATIVRTAEVFCAAATGRMNPADAVHRLLQTCVRLAAVPPADALAVLVPAAVDARRPRRRRDRRARPPRRARHLPRRRRDRRARPPRRARHLPRRAAAPPPLRCTRPSSPAPTRPACASTSSPTRSGAPACRNSTPATPRPARSVR